MKNLSLVVTARIGLTNMLALCSGPVAKIAPLQHVWLKVRFTEDEQKQMVMKDLGNGAASYQWPTTPDWGKVEVELEDSFASTLATEIEEYRGFHVTDIEWVEAVKAQLAKGKQ
jgi:hypothetical protein